MTFEPKAIRLLDNGSLIEYPGDTPWSDAHPVLWPILDDENGEARSEADLEEVEISPSETYIRSVEIRSLKGIHQARLDMAETLDDAPGWYVLAGGNGSGKSTLLRSLAIVMVGLPAGRLVNGSWIERGAEPAEASIRLTPIGEIDGKSEAVILQREFRGSDSIPPGVYFSGYGPFKRLEGGSDHARDLARSDPRMGRVITLFLEEASLWEVQKWLLRMGLKRKRLAHAVLDFVNSGLLPEGFRADSIVDEDLVLTVPQGPAVPLQMASDGPRCMAAMVLDILRGLEECHGGLQIEDNRVLNPGIVLIDEPDNHLHIHWQLRLGSWMKEHFPKIQFIIATHSPFLCVSADKIWRLDDDEGRIVPRILSDEEIRQIRNGSITSVLESDAFRIFNTLPPEARERHLEFLNLRRLSLQGRRLSPSDRGRLSELEEEFFGPNAPPDPEFDALFP